MPHSPLSFKSPQSRSSGTDRWVGNSKKENENRKEESAFKCRESGLSIVGRAGDLSSHSSDRDHRSISRHQIKSLSIESLRITFQTLSLKMLCWKGPSCCHLNQLHGMAPLHHWERTSASKWQEALATSVLCPLQEVHLNQTTHYLPIPKAIGVMWGSRTTNIQSPPQHKSRFPSRSMHRVLGRHKRHGSLYTQETKETVNEHVNPCAHWFGFSWVVLLMSSYFVAEKSSLSVKPGTDCRDHRKGLEPLKSRMPPPFIQKKGIHATFWKSECGLLVLYNTFRLSVQ